MSQDADTLGQSRWPMTALLTANGVSVTGDMMARLAVPWFVLQTTGSATRTGVSAVAITVPAIIAGIWGGALIDRFGHRRSSLWSDIASGATTALIPLIYLTVGLPFWLLVTLVFLGSLLDAPGRSARKALYPRLVTLAGTPLQRATSAYDGADRAGLLAGGPIAGGLIALIGPANVLWVNAATFLVSAALTFAAVPADPPSPTANAPLALRAYLTEVKDGLAFIATEPLVRVTIVMMLLLNAIDATTIVIVPVYADQLLDGAADIGLMMGALGLGALGGTLAFGVIGHRLPRRAVFVAGFLLLGSRFVAFALGAGLTILLASQLLAGMAAGPINPIMDALLYERVPEQLRGRIFATISAATLAAVPAGTIAAGYLAEMFPIRTVFATFAIAYLLIATTPMWSAPWRGKVSPS